MTCSLGWHRWICADVETHGDYLLQFFRCAKCDKLNSYCGFIPMHLFDETLKKAHRHEHRK